MRFPVKSAAVAASASQVAAARLRLAAAPPTDLNRAGTGDIIGCRLTRWREEHMHRVFLSTISAGLFFFSAAAWGQTSPCDLNQDGKVDSTDVQLAINMSLGTASCTANIAGPGVCNVVVVQRVVNAAIGGSCVAGSLHSVTLTWSPSTTSTVTGYNVYRSTTSGGGYSKLTSSPVAASSFSDTNVQSGVTYYYVTTAVDNTNTESAMSNQALAVIPVP
jgi:hypothetical protein